RCSSTSSAPRRTTWRSRGDSWGDWTARRWAARWRPAHWERWRCGDCPWEPSCASADRGARRRDYHPPMPARARAALLAIALLGALTGLAAARTAPGPRVAGCPVFPASNAWNRDVSRAPVDPRPAAYIRSIDSHSNHFLHADFGGGGAYGIPFNVVPRTQPRVPIHFTAYGDESDRGPYPVPPGARVEGGSDRHVLVVQRGTCRLFELYDAHRAGR